MKNVNYIFVRSKREFIPVDHYRITWGLLSKAVGADVFFYPEFFLKGVEIAKRSDLVKEFDIKMKSRSRSGRIILLDDIEDYAYVVTDEKIAELEKAQVEFMEPELACQDYVSILGYANFFDEGSLFHISEKSGGILITSEDVCEFMDKHMEGKPSDREITALFEKATAYSLSHFSIEKSEKIASWSNGEKFSLVEETIFKNDAGRYFLFGRSSSNEKYGNYSYDKYGKTTLIPGQSITPFSDDDAYEWLEEKCPDHPLLQQ